MTRILFTWRYFVALAITLAVLVLGYVLLEQTIFALDTKQFAQFIDTLGWAGPFVMIGLIAGEVVVAPLPGGWLSLATGYLFGPAAGFAYAYIGNLLGALIAFELARAFGQPFVRRLVAEEKYERYSQKMRRSRLGLILLYAIPLFPIDIVSLLLGISGVPRRRFITIIAIGFLPNMAILNFVGGAIAVPEYRYVMLVLVAVVMGYFILRAVHDYLSPTTPHHSPDKAT